MTQVLDSNGVLIAARKTMTLREGERISEHECNEEFHLLKLERDERAPNILYALPLGKTSLLDVPKGDLLSHTIYFAMEVATGRDLRRSLLDHRWQFISSKYIAWVGRQIHWRFKWLHNKKLLHGDLKLTIFLYSKG